MRLLLVSLVTLSAVVTSMQSASAQEANTRGARFNFAPNIYRTEASRVPKGYNAEPVHNVRAGSVPSSNLLGLDPSILAKPAPLPPVVAAHPAMPMVSAQAFVPKANANFNPMFGKPMVAQLPAPVPQQAVALPIQMKPVAAASAPTAKRHVATTALSGRLLKPKYRQVRPASAAPGVASYGNNFGYTPGAYLPSSGMSTQTDVHGVIVKQKRHR